MAHDATQKISSSSPLLVEDLLTEFTNWLCLVGDRISALKLRYVLASNFLFSFVSGAYFLILWSNKLVSSFLFFIVSSVMFFDYSCIHNHDVFFKKLRFILTF